MPKTYIDRTRRSLIFGGATLGGMAAAGCCSIPLSPQISGGCSPLPFPFLAGPEVLAAWAKPERFFDAHTHFFNAQDVPVAGFLTKSVAHSIKSENLRKLIIALAPVVEALANLAPTTEREHRELCRSSAKALHTLRAQSDDLDTEIDRRRDDMARELYKRILQEGDEIPRLFNEAVLRAKSRDINALRNQTTAFSEDFVREALRDGGSYRTSSKALISRRTSDMATEEAEAMSMKGALQFVGFMLAPRHHNLRTYIRRFSEHSPSLPLSGCFAAMVDFNYWLDCPAKASLMHDQVMVHEQLALLSRGFLMPLVAYNPWVDIKEGDASIKLVEKAVKEHGCVGVKIYPPMGFYAYGNAGSPIQSSEPRPDPVMLDKKLRTFYELCDDLGVPVMAHANESNGRDAAHDMLAGAKGWISLREQVGTLKGLRVNAGHFGGDDVHDSSDWTNDFVRLMSEPGGLRMYADLGYWERLLDKKPTQDNLAKILMAPLTGGTTADRVMYGSDWLMLSKEPGWETYGEGVAKVIRGLDPSGKIATKVLGGNVLECYGLTETSRRGAKGVGTFERLQKFHETNGLGWLKD